MKLRGWRRTCTITTSLAFTLLGHAHTHARVTCEARQAQPVVLIVDGYSSGSLLPPQFAAQGYRVIHIHASGKPKTFQTQSFQSANFVDDYAYDFVNESPSNRTKLLGWIRGYRPVAILPGAESGVLLADSLSAELSNELNLPSNGVSLARRNKFLMAERLKELGIPSVLQMKSKSLTEVLAWVAEHKLLPGKIVIKPLMSAGTDGVSFPTSVAEIEAAFAALHGKHNSYGLLNDEVLVQEFLEGTEYVVNTVSSRGIHVISDMWRYNKIVTPNGQLIYGHDDLIPFSGAVQNQLVPYALRVLEAMGIQTGWGHIEIIMTKRGPVLVEIGARMMGSLQPRLAREALGESQVELGIEAFLEPEKFAKRALGYKFKKHAALVTLNSTVDGKAFTLPPQLLEAIQALPGYTRHNFTYLPGEAVQLTTDLHNAIGQVELVYENEAQLKNSITTLRLWQNAGLFWQEPSTP